MIDLSLLHTHLCNHSQRKGYEGHTEKALLVCNSKRKALPRMNLGLRCSASRTVKKIISVV
jgi:hypothetical protein